MDDLEAKGVKCDPVTEARWGFVTTIEIPGGGKMGLCKPKHPTAHNL